MNLWKTTPKYSTRPRVEYRYFGQLWRLLVESSQSIHVFDHLWVNNWVFDSILDSIFGSRSSNLTSIHQFYDLASTRLRLQSFGICLHDEPWVWTPLCQYLLYCFCLYFKWKQNPISYGMTKVFSDGSCVEFVELLFEFERSSLLLVRQVHSRAVGVEGVLLISK